MYFSAQARKIKESTHKKFLIFSQKKAFLIFQETETPQQFFIFQETELFYISLYAREGIFKTLTYLQLEAHPESWYFQNPSIFRTGSIFRTMTYLELEAYSEPWYI